MHFIPDMLSTVHRTLRSSLSLTASL